MQKILLSVVFAALATAALASDGVLEINQTCAVETGCFAGDSAGLPVTISASGSYRLTSNLVVPDENTDGIQVSAEDVGIDLNNFVIQGLVVCSGVPLVCTPDSGTGSGVTYTSVLLSGTSVRNGSVRGMGEYGVLVGAQAEVTGLRVRSNRISGIRANDGSTVSGNTAYRNGDDGIQADFGASVLSNTAYFNDGDGIEAGSGSSVQRNTVRLNSGYGLNLAPDAMYRANVITNNNTGTVDGGVNKGDNSCNGTTSCP